MEKKTAHAAEQDRPDLVKRRQTWSEAQRDLDPQRLVFIDETWASTNMARRHGRAPRGERLRCGVPHGHWKTTTFVAALRLTGMVAPMVLDGPINGESFQAYVEQFLAPTLKRGDVVVMDNLGSHKTPAIRQAIRAGGCKAVLPARLLARSQPDRAGRRQTQAPAAQGRRTHQGSRLAQDRLTARPVHPAGMPKLHPKRRVWFRVESSRSSSTS